MKLKGMGNTSEISKTIIMGAYCVLVCACVTFSFKLIFFSLIGRGVEQDGRGSGIILNSRETLSQSAMGLDRADIIKIQTALNNLGYDTGGESDGSLGVKTQQALIKFQRALGLPADGLIEPQILKILGIDIGELPE